MGSIYTGIDLGTDSIKICVVEKMRKGFKLLASVASPSSYIDGGEITNTKGCVEELKKALTSINDMLGIKINKAICLLNPINLRMDIIEGSTNVMDIENISGADISNLLNNAINDIDLEDNELVTSTPINFVIDGDRKVKDPKGLSGALLESKIVISSINKSSLYRVLEVLKLAGVDTVDICFKSTGDYYVLKNNNLDNQTGAIINIGEKSSNISIFNKGIQIKNSTINMGSLNVDKDISYIYNCSLDVARDLKENFAYATHDDADDSEKTTILDKENNSKTINQVELSRIVEARMKEILNLASNEIKNLTNRRISYIIVTGGLSEINGMDHLIDIYYGNTGILCYINIVGIRHNKYSSVLGGCMYFDDKLSFREKKYNMVSNEDISEIVSIDGDVGYSNNNIISRVFGHFFD